MTTLLPRRDGLAPERRRRPTPSGSPAWPTRPACGCCTPSPPTRRDHRRRPRRGRRDQPVHLLPPRAQARRRRASSDVRQGGTATWCRSTRRAAPGCRTPPTPSWAPSPRGRAARPTCPPTSPSAPWPTTTGRTSAASTARASPPATPPSRPRLPTAAARWSQVAARAPLGRRGRRPGRRLDRRHPGLDPRLLRRRRRRPRSTSARASAAAASARRLLHNQVTAADDGGLWTLQTSIFPENRASIALHHSAGYRTVGVRETHRPAPRRLARHRHARTPQRGQLIGENRRSRRLLVTTNTELSAIAAPASIGFSSPAAASGRPATL